MTIRKYFFFFFLFFSFLNSFAQELEFEVEEQELESEVEQELEFEVEEETTEQSTSSQTPFFDFFNENFSGSFVGLEAAGDYGSRSNYSLQLQYNKTFGEWGKFVLTANGYSNKVVLRLKISSAAENQKNSPNCSAADKSFYCDLEDRISLSESNSGGELREAYFDLNLGSRFQISAGNKLVAFGQFEIFSPIDLFSLPSRFGNSQIGVSKLDNRLTQQTVQANIYPISNVEMQYFHFPKIALDPFFKDSLEQVSRETYDACIRGKTCRQADSDVTSGVNEQITSGRVTKIFLENETQTATRILFYPSWGTIGLTHHRGYGAFGLITTSKILNLENNETANATDDYISVTEKYLERSIYGLELAIPVGSWNWKFEIAHNPNVTGNFDMETKDLHPVNSNRDYYDRLDWEARKELADLLEWIREENDSKLSYNYKNTFIALGVDANLELWKLNLVLFYFQNTYDSKLQKGIDLFRKWENKSNPSNTPPIDSASLPSFNIARYWNENKETVFGVLAGIVPGGQGGSFYFSQEYFESLTIFASMEAVRYTGDTELVNNRENYYEPLEKTSIGFRTGLGYTF